MVVKLWHIFVGKWCPLETLLKRRVADTIEFLTDISDPPDILHIQGTTGYDGNGRNSVYRSFEKVCPTFILAGTCITSIKDGDGNSIFEEKSLGTDSEIPYFIIPHKEDHATTKLCFEKMDSEVTFVNSNSIHCMIKGKNVEIKSKIKITQCDCKVVKESLGLNGAFCKHCFVTR